MTYAESYDFSTLTDAVRSAGLDTALLTIQRFDGTINTVGAEAREDDANWDDLADHVGLEVMFAADIFMTRVTQSRERKATDFIAKQNLRHLNMLGYYPEVQQGDRAVVTFGSLTFTLDILGVEHDSQRTQTRLALQEYAL